jgi:hypothetical protein
MFQSQPYIAIIGLIYGAFTGAVITKTIVEDDYKKQEAVQVIVVDTTMATTTTTVEATTTTTTLPMAELSVESKKRIPKDETERCPEWESKFVEYGLPPKLFSYIAWRESRCNPKAHNTTLNKDGSRDIGLLQVNSTWKTVTKNICGTSIDGLFNVDCNLKVSKYLYENGGAGHWSM